ncbi:hypothetical protein B0H10DRAFT_2446758 [Mycena sp. CBHHK59/15]|nr:hypothetical protein B0H10DRAFT_2446758 [Mycena sp. CBHHK59/15]
MFDPASDDEEQEGPGPWKGWFQGELKSLGQEVTDKDFAVALLSSLPPDWDAFVRSTLSGSTPPESKTTISAILTEERRRNERDGEPDIGLIAGHHRHTPKSFRSNGNSYPTPTTSSPSTETTQFLRIPTSNTVDDYAQLLMTFTFAIMMSIDTKKTNYRFPFTEAEQKCVSTMRKLLTTKSQSQQPRAGVVQELVPHFHSFIKMFLMKRDGPAALKSSKFASVLECFLAVFAIRPGGILCKPERLTTVCASIKFWMRLCVAFEANQLYGRKLSAISRIGGKTRNATPQLRSAIRPANLHVTPDCMTFTYLKTTVHLPTLRHGIRKAVITLQSLFNDLEMGIKVPLEFPKVWKDNWTTEAAGDSFMQYNKFFDEDYPWLRGLLQSKKVNLVSLHGDGSPCYDRDGDVLLNSEVVNTIFAKNRAFLQLMMVLCYLTSSGSRGEEFAEYHALNGDRPRSIFMSPDGECTLSPRRIKTEGTTEQMLFLPSLVPPELRDILLKYLIVIRPVINILVRIRSRDGPAALGHLVESFTEAECGAKINRSSLRQIVTEMMRVYSTHQLPDGESEGVNIHDARMGRSSKTSHVHYGSKDKNMATDEFLNFRDASLELHQLMGLMWKGRMTRRSPSPHLRLMDSLEELFVWDSHPTGLVPMGEQQHWEGVVHRTSLVTTQGPIKRRTYLLMLKLPPPLRKGNM